MCEPSKIAEDWVKKGFHIHVGGVELIVAPDHLQGVVFQEYFASTSTAVAAVAIKTAREECLPNSQIRKQWVRDARRAILFMLGYRGSLQAKANGRMLEFKFLILALERYEA